MRASTANPSTLKSVHRFCTAAALVLVVATATSQAATAQVREPDAKNDLPVKPNPTATISAVCHKLGERDYSQLIHATCYSELNKVVVVLVSGNAGSVTGEKIGQVIANEFSKKYIPTVAFLENPERSKVSISYLLNGDFYGPYSGKNWRDGINVLKLHSAQAWYQKPN